MKKSLLWLLIVVLAVSIVVTFSLAGCKEVAPVAEEEVAEEEVAAEKKVPLSALDKIKAEGRKPVVGFIYLLEADYLLFLQEVL